MASFDRVLLFLLDSVGVGWLPDAEAYGDTGAATVQHTLEYDPNLAASVYLESDLENLYRSRVDTVKTKHLYTGR